MKVKELKEILNMFDDDMVILMSKDSEGNAFKHIRTADELVVFEDYEYDCRDWGCPGCETDVHTELAQVEDVPEDISDHKVAIIWPF